MKSKNLMMEDSPEYLDNKFLYYSPSKPALPKAQDLLYQALTKKIGVLFTETGPMCVLCKAHVRVNFETKKSGRSGWEDCRRMPNFVVKDCGHGFHETCLYNFLTELEPPEQLDVKCGCCRKLRSFPKPHRWNALQIEASMDRVRCVLPDGKFRIEPSGGSNSG